MKSKPTIGIVGRRGAYGRWLERFFVEQMHLDVIGRDPAGDTALDESELIERSDVLLFSAPIRQTPALIDRYRELANGREANQLWLDVTSIKAAPVAAMLRSKAEVVGLHPMCAPPKSPTLRGRPMVVCEGRLSRWRPWLEQLLRALEAQCVHADPQRHDDKMAAVQGLVHAAHLAQAAALAQSVDQLGTPADILPFRSVSFELDMAMASRILASNPAIYSDIQFENPAALPMLNRYVESLTALRDCIAEGGESGRERFRTEFFDRGRAYFGETTLAEGNHSFERIGYLLADLAEQHVLDIHLINDQPGALRQLLTLLEDEGINLRSIHSSRTPRGEVHFRIGCDGSDGAQTLDAVAESIERSGLGRRIQA